MVLPCGLIQAPVIVNIADRDLVMRFGGPGGIESYEKC